MYDLGSLLHRSQRLVKACHAEDGGYLQDFIFDAGQVLHDLPVVERLGEHEQLTNLQALKMRDVDDLYLSALDPPALVGRHILEVPDCHGLECAAVGPDLG